MGVARTVRDGLPRARIALVHDWLVTRGGSERVLEALVELLGYPPIYTLLYKPRAFVDSPISQCRIHTSALQRLPGAASHHRWLLPLMPYAIEQFDLSGYDIVISSSHAVAKGVLTRADQLHISYIHTPMRYAWDLYHEYLRGPRHGEFVGGPKHGVPGSLAGGRQRGGGRFSVKRLVTAAVLHYIRLWDLASAARPDVLVANSRYVAARIWKTYRRRAHVIYPPVEVERFRAAALRGEGSTSHMGAVRLDGHDFTPGTYYVTHGRLVEYKRVDLLVRAFTQLGRPLLVIGEGPERRRIQPLAGPRIRFVGAVDDETLAGLVANARAFVFAADEDFGIAPVEAQAAGCPVLAYSRGGAAETVIDGSTGVFFHEQTVEAVIEAVRRFEAEEARFDRVRIMDHATLFSVEQFRSEFADLLDRAWHAFRRRGSMGLATLAIAGAMWRGTVLLEKLSQRDRE